jgi:3-dehydrosphinganine reductase
MRAELTPKNIKVWIVYPPDTDRPQLTFESKYKPFETRELANSDKPIQPALVAKETLRAVERGRYAVVPGLNAKFTYFLGTRFGNWVYPIMDIMIANIQKKKARLDK